MKSKRISHNIPLIAIIVVLCDGANLSISK